VPSADGGLTTVGLDMDVEDVGGMKSGPSRVNAPLRDLWFQGPEGTFSTSGKMTIQAPRQASRVRVGRCMPRKSWGGEMERTGNGAVTVGEQGDVERLWVSAWCLREVYKKEYNVRGRFRSHVSAGSAEIFG
jgi:hypothetical protein